ncbi:MAG: aldose 1-epimerase family protein [Puia sp.]|nr:aldose 1-epimerase family protein [Puia sp.]
MPDSKRPAWAGKISNPAQIGGIETSVLDNGGGRGTRIAWVNTGAGLRYKIIIDRGMDISDAFYNQYGLAWLNHAGITAPQPLSHRGTDWLRTFGGGLLTTCGLSHVGGPEKDSHGERGLHGDVSNIAAEIESIIQPDPVRGKMDMSITGVMKQTPIFGPSLELRRTLSGTIGRSSIRIHDEVTNRGNSPAPHMILYHCNFGWPLVDEGSELCWKGHWKPRYADGTEKIFREGHPFRKAPAPLEAHAGTGEEAAVIDTFADSFGHSSCGIWNEAIGLAVVLRYPKKQLPWLTNWQHWGRNEYVTGLEPGTNAPIGQAKARELKELILLEPGESRTYDLEIEVLTAPAEIAAFKKLMNTN